MAGDYSMRASTPELRALLAGNQFVKCNLFTFTLISGQQYFWTDADVDVVVRATHQVFSSTGPSISGVQYKLVRGLQVDNYDLQVLVKETDTVAGVPWPVAVRSGALDGATMLIEKAFLPAWGQPAETLQVIAGEVTPGYADLTVTLTVNSDADKFNTMVPRLLFQPACMRTLFDAGCTVSRPAYTFTGSVSALSSQAVFFTDMTQADDYFSRGRLLFTSGANTGVRRAIKVHAQSQGRLELSFPLLEPVAVGDRFTITAGCDKTQGTNGCAKFNNLPNFKGTPYIPKPEAIL